MSGFRVGLRVSVAFPPPPLMLPSGGSLLPRQFEERLTTCVHGDINIMRHIITAIIEAAQDYAYIIRQAVSRHFSFGHGGSMSGLFLKVPFLPLSAWIEWGAPPAGFGTERSGKHSLEFFMGTVRGVLCIEKTVERDGPEP